MTTPKTSLISGIYWSPRVIDGYETHWMERFGWSAQPGDQIVDLDGDCSIEVQPPFDPQWDGKSPDFPVTISLLRRTSKVPIFVCHVPRTLMFCEPYMEKKEI